VEAGHGARGGQRVGDRSGEGVAQTEPCSTFCVVDVPHHRARPLIHPAILPERTDTPAT